MIRSGKAIFASNKLRHPINQLLPVNVNKSSAGKALIVHRKTQNKTKDHLGSFSAGALVQTTVLLQKLYNFTLFTCVSRSLKEIARPMPVLLRYPPSREKRKLSYRRPVCPSPVLPQTTTNVAPTKNTQRLANPTYRGRSQPTYKRVITHSSSASTDCVCTTACTGTVRDTRETHFVRRAHPTASEVPINPTGSTRELQKRDNNARDTPNLRGSPGVRGPAFRDSSRRHISMIHA